jgi:CHAT domain-containing protein/tetratricopeptide (TPR) repeat protein
MVSVSKQEESKEGEVDMTQKMDIRQLWQLAQQLKENSDKEPQVLVLVIKVYEQILEHLQLDKDRLIYAAAQANMGNAYLELPTGDRAANLAQAIGCYRQALRFWTPEEAPLDYAATQMDLGTVYVELPTGDRAANLAQAIHCYQQALGYYTPEAAPQDYSAIQNNLGIVYIELPTGDRAANLAQAIDCYQQALRFRTPEAAPMDYATTQNNLGNAYQELPTGDRAANLAQAIQCYQQALRFWTPEAAPRDYARTLTNLGTVYRELPTGDRAANLAQAIHCYQQALGYYTPEAAPQDYSVIQNNLGIAYVRLPTGDRAANLAQAIDCFQEALRFRKPDVAPLEYAMIQNNLGNAYRELPTGDQAVNLAQAIRCFQEALRFRTPEVAPLEYAMTQANMGNAYMELPTGDRAANLAQAIGCYQQALRFLTPEAAPLECRRTNRNLADLYFTQGAWQAALDAYQAAIEAGERLYRAGLSAASKSSEIAANVSLNHRAAFAAARCGKPTQALLILERGKTRLLAESLRLQVPRPANVPDEVWAAFEQAGANIRAAQAGATTQSGEELTPVEAYEARVQAARAANAALDEAIGKVRTYAPHFLEAIDLPTVEAQLADRQTALIAFCITEQGSIGFVVSQHDQEIQIIEMPTFTQTDLKRLIAEWDADGQPTGGWLVAYAYNRFFNDRTTFEGWQGTIIRVLAELGERLLTPLLFALSTDIERIIFLPSAELFLFPLHAVPLAGNASELLCDRYQISYAPSIEVLVDVRARVRQQVTPELYAVINPEADPHLVFTAVEGTALAQLFAQRTLDAGRDGTKQRVLAGMPGRSYLHFSCHGSYDWYNPPASGLNLADIRLTLADLQQGEVDLSAARLVTLSACETGISDVLRGSAEEYVGIPAGFLLAGVPCVVSSLWSVPDLSTALLMERFYSNHLKSGMDFAAALRKAQLWVRNLQIGEVAQYAERCYLEAQEDEKAELYRLMRSYRALAKQNPTLRPFEHAYYWAAFTVNGM